MTFLGAALSSLAEGGYQPRLTDFRGGQNAKPLYELSRRCNDLLGIAMLNAIEALHCGSMSMTSTLRSLSTRAPARFIAVVVLPTPPL